MEFSDHFLFSGTEDLTIFKKLTKSPGDRFQQHIISAPWKSKTNGMILKFSQNIISSITLNKSTTSVLLLAAPTTQTRLTLRTWDADRAIRSTPAKRFIFYCDKLEFHLKSIHCFTSPLVHPTLRKKDLKISKLKLLWFCRYNHPHLHPSHQS